MSGMGNITQLDPQQAATWPANLLIIDVREAWELELAHLRHLPALAVRHIPLGQFPLRVAELDQLEQEGKTLGLLCHHGVRSMNAAHYLLQQGFERVANITGGIDAWARTDAGIGRY
jgi:rhodanese-related sulfurtransferase